MQQYMINENGQYVGTIDTTQIEIISRLPETYQLTAMPPMKTTDYWDGSSWVDIGYPQQPFLSFDYKTKTWIDNRDINGLKKSLWDAIKYERNKLEFGGFMYKEHKYDSDQISQGRILAAMVFGQPQQWTTSDNTVVNLTSDEVVELATTMGLHVASAHEQARIARGLVEEAQTVADLDAILFNGKQLMQNGLVNSNYMAPSPVTNYPLPMPPSPHPLP